MKRGAERGLREVMAPARKKKTTTGNWLLLIRPSTTHQELPIFDLLCVLVVDAGVDASMRYIIRRQYSATQLTWNFNCRKHS